MTRLLTIYCDSGTDIYQGHEVVYGTQFCETVPRVCLNIPHTMELVEAVGFLKLLMLTNRFPRPCGGHATVFKGLRIIKPLEKLAELRNNWRELVERDCLKELAKCSDHEFLINCRSTQILCFCVSLSWRPCISPKLL